MNDKLKVLLESNVLSDENQAVIKEAFDTAVNEAVETRVAEATQEIQRSAVELIDELVQEQLEPIQEEIKHARTLEYAYAQKIVDFKENYEQRQEEILALQIEEAVQAEMEGIKADIEAAKKYTFATQMFEQFRDMYEKMGFAEGQEDIQAQLESTQAELDTLRREKIMNETLEGIVGKKREIALSILESVATDKIADRFDDFKGALLDQKVEDDKVTESAEADEPAADPIAEGVVVTEDAPADEPVVTESTMDPAKLERLNRSLERINRR